MSRQTRCVAPLLMAMFLTACLQLAVADSQPVMWAHFIDVGQADATLLEFPCGSILIDTGAQDYDHVDDLKDYLAEALDDDFGPKHVLDSIILTHYHPDHKKGLKQIIQAFKVRKYVHNGALNASDKSLVQFVEDYSYEDGDRISVREISDSEITGADLKTGLTDGDIDPVGADCDECDPEIRILSGRLQQNPGWTKKEFGKENNHSLVIRVDFGDASFLFTGDLQDSAIGTLLAYYEGSTAPNDDDDSMLDVDVYQVGHHGSDNATTQPLLDAMTPETAVISVGQWNYGLGTNNKFTTYHYGHPRKDVLDLLSPAIPKYRSSETTEMVADGVCDFHPYTVKKKIYATAWDGNIGVRARWSGSMAVYRNR